MTDYSYLNGHPLACTCVDCTRKRKLRLNLPRYKDIRWKDLKDFLWNRPNHKRYIPGVYMCEDFARDLRDDAKASKIDCSLVYIDLVDGSGHMCNAFYTLDEGRVFLDGTGFQEGAVLKPYTRVKVQVDSPYIPEFIFPQEGYKRVLKPMGIVRSIDVV